MSQKPNKKAIGLFLLIGMITFVLIIAQSIINKFWTDDKYITVMYFDESVKGLNVGSSVMFNGVEIGKVIKIEIISNPHDLTFKIPVYAQLHPISNFKEDSFWEIFGKDKNTLDLLIEKGLRAQLQTQSFLTGQLMIELSMMPDEAPKTPYTEGDRNDDIPEIPTVLSPTGALSRGIQNLPIKRTFDRLDRILTTMENNVPVLIPALTKTAQNLEKISGKIEPATTETIENLNDTLYNISDAMKSFRNLTDYLEQYPESLLKGKKK